MERRGLYPQHYNNKENRVIRREAGFTLIELLITMVIFILVIAAGSQIFTGLLTQFKQQSKIAETNIEGIVGLEILRQDMEHAGYGLPWVIPTGVTYSEASSPPASTYNDASNPPRAIVSGNNTALNGSDYLVVKSVKVAPNFTAGKWQPLRAGTSSSMKTWWVPSRENVCRKDDDAHFPNVRVIVLSPGSTSANSRSLVVSGGSFFTGADDYTNLANFAPAAGDTETRIMYGVDPDTNLRMPFNRADYYISTANVPQRCAAPGTGTGVLVKSVIEHATGNRGAGLPLLDCVADMQVIYRIDSNNNGTIDFATDNLATLTDTNSNGIIDAQEIREQIKEVRVYILAHEGQRDVNYDATTTYPGNQITIPPTASDPGFGLGSTFDFVANGITNWQNYRWKVYTIVVKPNNLR